MEKSLIKNVWIDTDPGIDDAIAIVMLMFSPNIKIIGISSSYGNLPIENTTRNVQSVCWLFKRESIPIVQGLDKPFIGEAKFDPQIHGITLANLDLPIGRNIVYTEDPLSKIRDFIMNSKGKITFISLAPCTNTSLLLKLYPEVLDKIEEIVIMGGARGLGNVNSNVSEFNIFTDPIAAQMLFKTKNVKLTIITADEGPNVRIPVTRYIELFEEAGKNVKDYVPSTIIKILQFVEDAEFKIESQNVFLNKVIRGGGGYDTLASAYVINEKIFDYCFVDAEVEISTGKCFGKTIFIPREKGDTTGIKFLQHTDIAAYEDIYLKIFRLMPSS